ncbi:hypothetical protein PENSPDRAFT_651056 [Peniophora sp. CONT]|nr:hypothetical protein PENSPDRAFT_651056 [Peniophora sp. CONT]
MQSAAILAASSPATAVASAVPVCSKANEASAPTNLSAPQCCHCGWRGSHAPNCPFR